MKSYITSDPDILAGTPVIDGTRIPIARILSLLKQGYTLENISDDYPYVDPKLISKAIDEAIAMLDKQLDTSHA